MITLPPVEVLLASFTYCPGTGEFCVHRTGRPPTATNGHGYLQVRFRKRAYLVHRVIWKMMTKQDPAGHIDHRNHVRSDNRWANLRAATRSQNNRNSSRKGARSGFKGAFWEERRQKWCSFIYVDGRNKWLGYFETARAAADAYAVAAQQHYGAFASYD